MYKTEDIAVVGIACRFPGADDIDEFWKVLQNGEDHVKVIPKERWDTDTINIPNLENDWKPYAEKSGLVNEFDKWDNKFFGISDSEAGWMDPQQCMALEVTHSALEDGGFTYESIKGTNTGVYIGAMNRDPTFGMNESVEEFNNFLVTGFAPSIIANRLSYHFDIRGPSITLDTACSSALVAIHLGCQALKSGDCDMAICGGVNSILSPVNYISLYKAGMISQTGKCHTFSKEADGYARGEGCGMVILKPLKKAKEDGNKIWGIVMSGCNQDGKTNKPITAPSGQQQKMLLSKLYSEYNIDAATIQYIEAHGTGTRIGDQTESMALADFFASKRKDKKIPVGSVKSNIGHLESSAGTAGLIKVLLMMKHQQLVPSLHCDTGNSVIDLAKSPLVVSSNVSEWHPREDGSRISCVNSFGFGGTNSHVIVRKDPPSTDFNKHDENILRFLIAISAATPNALTTILTHFLDKLKTSVYSIGDLSYTSLLKRDHHRYRMVYVVKNISELKEKLTLTIDSKEEVHPNVNGTQLISIFCGVGTVWLGMCKEYITSNVTFIKTVKEIDLELKKYTRISIDELLKNQPSNLETDPFVGPIAIFVCQVGLYKMWEELGVSPDIIIGQSVGEVAAAYAAGCLTLPEAVKVTYYRSVFSANASGGRMLVVGRCNVQSLQDLLNSYDGKLHIAVYSSDETVVVSGDLKSIQELISNLSSHPKFQSVLLKELEVQCAYHSPCMTKASKNLASRVCNLPGRRPMKKIISTVTGEEIVGPEMCSAEYWSKNLLQPVVLREAVLKAIDPEKRNIFLEIGPRPILRAHLKHITDKDAVAVPSCDKNEESKTFANAVALLHVNGIPFNLDSVAPQNGILTDIPRYKFDRCGHLLTSEAVRASLQCSRNIGSNHPFVFKLPLSNGYRVILSKESTPYIYEHVLDQMYIAPGALHLEIGLEVLKSCVNQNLSEISLCAQFVRPLDMTRQQKVDLNVYVSKKDYSFEIQLKHKTICKGSYFQRTKNFITNVDISQMKRMCPIYISQDVFYGNLLELGFVYGPSLTVVKHSWRSDTHYLAEISLPDDVAQEMQKMHLHPCISDGILQTAVIPWFSQQDHGGYTSRDKVPRLIPVKIGALTLRRVPERCMYVYGRLAKFSQNHVIINVLLLSKQGELIAEVENYEMRNVTEEPSIDLSDKSYETRWLKMEINLPGKITKDFHHTLCLCQTKSSFDLCKIYCSGTFSVSIFLDRVYEHIESEKVYERIHVSLQSKQMKVTDFNQIIYFPGFRQSSKILDTDEVYRCVSSSALLLLAILQRFIENGIDIPIFIVTEKTQPSVPDEEYIYNLSGSELWGMCRCLAKEGTYSNLKMVDLSNDNDIELLYEIVVNTKTDDFWKRSSEFKISNKTIYINQVIRFNGNSLSQRTNHYNSNQPLELRSKDHKCLDDLFFVEKTEESDKSRYVKLKVENALVNQDVSAITTTLAVNDPDPWKLSRPEGHPVIASEISGAMCVEIENGMENNTRLCMKSAKIHPLKNRNQDNSFISCFPCKIANTVYVPADCVIRKNAFPVYRPGLMYKCIMYFALMDQLKTDIPIGIIHDDLSKSDMTLLKVFCRTSKIKIAFVIEITDFVKKYNMDGKYQILLLLNNELSTCIGTCASKINTSAARVITSSQYMDKPSERLFRQKLPNVEIAIVNCDDVVSLHRLPKLVKRLEKWLPKAAKWFKNDQSIACCDTGEITINFDSPIEVENEIHAEHYTVQVIKGTLFNKYSGYMVIGGLTGLGWETVQLIARMDGGCIAILGRRDPSEQRRREIQSLSEKYQCHIIHLRTDISNYESLESAFQEYTIKCKSFPLKGIFQGAAVVADSIIVNMTTEMFESVLKPKILGTLNLHNLTREMKLDYFVLQSSVTSIFGNSGQTNYGAGNSFMDTFAYFRNSNGLSGQTINWGALNLGLLISSDRVEKHLKRQGYESMKSDEIIDCLLHTLSSNIIQIVYGIFRWDTMVRQSPDMMHLTSKFQPLLTELNMMDIFAVKKGTKITISLQDLLNLESSDRDRKIEEVLSLIVADILAVELQIIQTTTKFAAIGIDSMKAMAFINTIYEHFSCRIPVVKVLDIGTDIATIASLISDQVAGSSDDFGIVPVDKMLRAKELVMENGEITLLK